MAINWDLYSKKLNMSGNNIRERQINLMKDAYANDFSHSPSYRESYFNGSSEITDIQVLDTKVGSVKTVYMLPDDVLAVGDVLEFDGDKWLCINAVDNGVNMYGTVNACEHTLSVYKNSNLFEVPLAIESGVRLYQLGIENNKFIDTPSTVVTARVPNNSITETIRRDDVYQIGRQNWKVTDVNDIIEPDLLILKLKWTANQPTIKEHLYSIEILNGEEVSLYGGEHSTLQLNIKCTLDGILVDNPEVEYTSSNEMCATVDSTGLITVKGTGSTIITATYGNASANILVKSLLAIEDSYDITITPADTTIFVNQSKTFTAIVTNNGVNMPYHGVVWSVDDTANKYCTYEVDDREITIKSKNIINKSIKITATLLNNASVKEDRIITTKSLV